MAQPAAEATAQARSAAFDLKNLTAQYDFTGKTVVITGGTGILGSDIAGELRTVRRYQSCGVKARRCASSPTWTAMMQRHASRPKDTANTNRLKVSTFMR